MLSCLLTFLIFVLVVVIVAWIIHAGMEAMGVGIPANVQKVVMLIVALIALLFFLQCALGGGDSLGLGRLWRCP